MSDIENHIVGLPDSWKILARAIDKYIKSYDPEYTIDQVKNKFGSMRYYFSFSTVPADALANIGQTKIQDRVQEFADLTMYME